MALLVHLAPQKWEKRILKNGIKSEKTRSFFDRSTGERLEEFKGVYAMPVMQDYLATYQWNRELKRDRTKAIVGIQFQMDDNETVYVGRYYECPQKMKLSEAVKLITEAEDKMGYEIIIPHRIESREIKRSVSVNTSAGWRYSPGAHKSFFCVCPGCVGKGVFKADKMKGRKYNETLQKLKKAKTDESIVRLIHALSNELSDYRKKRKSISDIQRFLEHPSDSVRKVAFQVLGQYEGGLRDQILLRYCKSENQEERKQAVEFLLDGYQEYKKHYTNLISLFENDNEMFDFIEEKVEWYKELDLLPDDEDEDEDISA